MRLFLFAAALVAGWSGATASHQNAGASPIGEDLLVAISSRQQEQVTMAVVDHVAGEHRR